MRALIFGFISSSLLFFSCSKSESFDGDNAVDYTALQPGRYTTYRLDSTVFLNFGTTVAVHSYQEKHIVDAQITDAMGRESYRIFRYLRNAAGTDNWKYASSYFVTPVGSSVELIEDNLRFVKLSGPIATDHTWRGNRYLPTRPYPAFNFLNDVNMSRWDNTISSTGETITLEGKSYSDVITIDGINESSNVPIPASRDSYSYINYQQEMYAKGIGMIYQNYIMWDFQGKTASIPNGAQNGFGVERTIIDHN